MPAETYDITPVVAIASTIAQPCRIPTLPQARWLVTPTSTASSVRAAPRPAAAPTIAAMRAAVQQRRPRTAPPALWPRLSRLDEDGSAGHHTRLLVMLPWRRTA